MTGNPKPRIRWFKNNRVISVNRGKYRQLPDGSLLIRSVQAMDSGRYMCVGDNGVGVKSNSVDLTVPSKFVNLSHSQNCVFGFGSGLGTGCLFERPVPQVHLEIY